MRKSIHRETQGKEKRKGKKKTIELKNEEVEGWGDRTTMELRSYLSG